MTDEKLKKIERIKQGLDRHREDIRNNAGRVVDDILVEEIDFLVTELVSLMEKYNELSAKELKRLQAIDDFEAGC